MNCHEGLAAVVNRDEHATHGETTHQDPLETDCSWLQLPTSVENLLKAIGVDADHWRGKVVEERLRRDTMGVFVFRRSHCCWSSYDGSSDRSEGASQLRPDGMSATIGRSWQIRFAIRQDEALVCRIEHRARRPFIPWPMGCENQAELSRGRRLPFAVKVWS